MEIKKFFRRLFIRPYGFDLGTLRTVRPSKSRKANRLYHQKYIEKELEIKAKFEAKKKLFLAKFNQNKSNLVIEEEIKKVRREKERLESSIKETKSKINEIKTRVYLDVNHGSERDLINSIINLIREQSLFVRIKETKKYLAYLESLYKSKGRLSLVKVTEEGELSIAGEAGRLSLKKKK